MYIILTYYLFIYSVYACSLVKLWCNENNNWSIAISCFYIITLFVAVALPILYICIYFLQSWVVFSLLSTPTLSRFKKKRPLHKYIVIFCPVNLYCRWRPKMLGRPSDTKIIGDAVEDAYKRLILPLLTRSYR